jgi:hypothetical protein
MDLVADTARALPRYDEADDQITFRKLQKERIPGLDREEFQTLFAEWQEHYHAKVEIDRKLAEAKLVAFTEEHAKTRPPPPFKCVCGAEAKNPFDPDWMRVHQPHCQNAGAACINWSLYRRLLRRTA